MANIGAAMFRTCNLSFRVVGIVRSFLVVGKVVGGIVTDIVVILPIWEVQRNV